MSTDSSYQEFFAEFVEGVKESEGANHSQQQRSSLPIDPSHHTCYQSQANSCQKVEGPIVGKTGNHHIEIQNRSIVLGSHGRLVGRRDCR
jgi:hypothetical protein